MDNLTSWVQYGLETVKQRGNTTKTTAITTAAMTVLLLYMSLVRYMRYKNLEAIKKRYPDPQHILDHPEAAQDVHAITTKLEFPYLARQGIELALFKTFTIPTISKLLAATAEFSTNVARRTEDTEMILNEIVDTYGRIQKQLKLDPNTPKDALNDQWNRPQEAVQRLNEIHGKFNILNDDYIYTLALFISEGESWVNRYDWRKLDIRESNAMFRVWYDVGVAMNIKDIPDTPRKMNEFKETYAKKAIRYAPSNWQVGEHTLRHLLSRFAPSFLIEPAYQAGLKLLPSILDPEDVVGFQLPYPESKIITLLVKSVLHIRGIVVRHFMLPRSNYVNRTPFYANEENRFVPEFFIYKPHIYKNGYRISELGPKKFLHKKQVEIPTTCPFAKA